MTSGRSRYYEFGNFRLDAMKRLLLRGGQLVPLSPKAFDTLLVLVENSHRVVEKDELMRVLWPHTIVEENNLTVNMSALRKSLGESPSDHRYIVTLPGHGYRFVAPVKKIGLAAPTEPTIKSIAVLPLKLLGANNQDDYLELGLADALITRLGNLKQVVVRPTSAVRKYNTPWQDAVAAGQELQVDAVLEGSIRSAGGRLRVTVQLVSIPAGVPLWGDIFDESFTDIFAVEDAISQRVVEALTLKLTGTERQRLRKRYTDNTTAYQLYLKGRYFWNRRTEEGLKKAVEYFHQAIQSDPNYALAYAGLADSYTLLGSAGYSSPPARDALTQAKDAAQRALALDDSLAEAHAALGFVHFRSDWDWARAEAAFKRAIELNPNYATGYHWYALFLIAMGRTDEAGQIVERALELDPLSLIINSCKGRLLHFSRRYPEAIEQYRKTLELDPNFAQAHFDLGMAYLQQGLFEEALLELKKSENLSGGRLVTQAVLGYAYGVAGRKRECQKILKELLPRAERGEIPAYLLALIYVGLGDKEQALPLLDRAYEERYGLLVYLKVEPLFDLLRPEPRFQQLLHRIGLN